MVADRPRLRGCRATTRSSSLIAFVGTINPSAGSVSVFVPLEHALLSRASPMASARAFRALQPDRRARRRGRRARRGQPRLLAGSGSSARRVHGHVPALCHARPRGGLLTAPSAGRAAGRGQAGRPRSGPSRRIVYRLAALFSVDAFAGGFVVQSLLALWLFDRFGLSLAGAPAFLLLDGRFAAFSFPVAAWLSRRIGLVNTMVFTHIPSSLCLIARRPSRRARPRAGAAARPCGPVADGCTDTLVLCHGGRDAARTPGGRAASPRFRAASPRASPAIAGALFAAGLQAWPLVICGVLKISTISRCSGLP